MQGGVTGQTSITTTGCGVSTIAMETPGPPIPGTPQLRTLPRLVRLVTMPKAFIPAQTAAVTTLNSHIPQTLIINISRIQDKTPQPVTIIKQEPPNVTTNCSSPEGSCNSQKKG